MTLSIFGDICSLCISIDVKRLGLLRNDRLFFKQQNRSQFPAWVERSFGSEPETSERKKSSAQNRPKRNNTNRPTDNRPTKCVGRRGPQRGPIARELSSFACWVNIYALYRSACSTFVGVGVGVGIDVGVGVVVGVGNHPGESSLFFFAPGSV